MLPSLHAFLCEQDLGQYYDSFIRAGATDRDVPQLLHLNDNELNEFLSAVRMLPFHAVVLKKGLRVLRSKIHSEQQSESSSPAPPVSTSHQHHQRVGIDMILNNTNDTVSSCKMKCNPIYSFWLSLCSQLYHPHHATVTITKTIMRQVT